MDFKLGSADDFRPEAMERVLKNINAAVYELKNLSEVDKHYERYYKIAITDLEKTYGLLYAYVTKGA